ncbi:unnamed protein product [Prorocentrum cordatum]|uniref:RRM domain-containing protein n=1 Tax=Prorocentrum cordatum TaxID=2364126 RepID=A0ABN9PE44_9DINO|nr:unnamed protein product [Polarella glacialis]
MTRAVHALPGIREQFADDPVTSVSIDEGNGWAFVELASRELAGALVSVGRLWLSSGGRVSVGWPAAQAQRAPARLASPDPARRQPGAGHAAAPDCGVDLWLGAPPESAIGERLDCEIYMRCAGRLESMPVWYALLELFQSLPAYHLAYGDRAAGHRHLLLFVFGRCPAGNGWRLCSLTRGVPPRLGFPVGHVLRRRLLEGEQRCRHLWVSPAPARISIRGSDRLAPAWTRSVVNPIAVAERLDQGAHSLAVPLELVDLAIQAHVFLTAVLDSPWCCVIGKAYLAEEGFPTLLETLVLDEGLLQWLSCYSTVVGETVEGEKNSSFSFNDMRALADADPSRIAVTTLSGLKNTMLKVSPGNQIAIAIASAQGDVNDSWGAAFAPAMPKEKAKQIVDRICKANKKGGARKGTGTPSSAKIVEVEPSTPKTKKLEAGGEGMWIAGQNVELGRPGASDDDHGGRGDADGDAHGGHGGGGGARRPEAHGPEAPLPEADGGGPAPAGGLTATLWVGNLQPSESKQGARERQLRAHVAGCLPEGQGAQIRKVTMHRSGRCAFLDLNNAEIANKIVAALKGSEFDGATLASRLVQVRRHSPSCDAIGEAQKKTKKRRSSAAPKEEASDAEASPKEEASDADASSAAGEPSTGGGCPPPEAAEEKQEQGAEASPAEDPPLEGRARAAAFRGGGPASGRGQGTAEAAAREEWDGK